MGITRMKAVLARKGAMVPARIRPRPPMGQVRKVAILGGASSIQYAPWHDWSWELWSHASCRHRCVREPDLFFDLHPPALWRDPVKKNWDPGYLKWLQQNHVPIYMQEHYPEVPCSMRYPFETMITEFPRGYMTNSCAYMIALALMRGVTAIAAYGCHYDSRSEYGAQRGSMEYWLGVAEGRGVQVLIPPTCDLLGRPSLLYGYQSHPNGKRDPSYTITAGIPPKDKTPGIAPVPQAVTTPPGLPRLYSVHDPECPPLMTASFAPPAIERSHVLPVSITGAVKV